MSKVMESNVRGKLSLKSRELIEKHASEKTLYRISKDGDVSYSTIHRWQDTPNEVEAVKLSALASFLIGLGLSVEDIKAMPFGDVFDVQLNDAAE